MGQVTRPATGDEVLELANCPCCGGEISVGDCGYSTFNPGWAECKLCKRKWAWSCVKDRWDVGQLWNDLAKLIKHKLSVLSYIGVTRSTSIISRDFRAEKLQEEAAVLLEEFKKTIIGADRPKT